MKYTLKTLSYLFLCLSISGCAYSTINYQKKILPRASFLKIEKILLLKICKKSVCKERKLRSSGSAAIVKTTPLGAYALTAEHVCNDSDIIQDIKASIPGVKIVKSFVVRTIDGEKLPVDVVDMNEEHDICMLWVDNLFEPPILIASKKPEPGDRVFNLAAPLGIWDENMIPIFDGFYNGIDGYDRALYSIPAFGGSSGSPIVNTRGELIGMIHSTLRFWPQIVISPNYKAMRAFINNSIEKSRYSRIVNVFLNAWYRSIK